MAQLTPLSLGELDGADARSRLWLCGSYPDGGVVDGASFPLRPDRRRPLDP